jgi:hypothetical protein
MRRVEQTIAAQNQACMPKMHQWPVAVFGYFYSLVMVAIATFFVGENGNLFQDYSKEVNRRFPTHQVSI